MLGNRLAITVVLCSYESHRPISLQEQVRFVLVASDVDRGCEAPDLPGSESFAVVSMGGVGRGSQAPDLSR